MGNRYGTGMSGFGGQMNGMGQMSNMGQMTNMGQMSNMGQVSNMRRMSQLVQNSPMSYNKQLSQTNFNLKAASNGFSSGSYESIGSSVLNPHSASSQSFSSFKNSILK